MDELDVTSLEWVNSRCATGLPALLGIEFVESSDSLLRSRMTVGDNHLAPNGFLHAATSVALADTTCGMGTVVALRGRGGFTTIELKSNFLGTTTSGRIDCSATPVHLGRTTHVWDAVVTAETGRKIAAFRCTQLVLGDAKA